MTGSNGALVTSASPDTLTAQGRRTRAALVRAAEVVFAERGYAGTRIGDITAQAEVSVGTFYGYFSAKEEIFVALVGEYRDRLRAALTEATDVRALNERYLELFRRDPRLWAVLEEAALSKPELRPAVAECRREFVTATRSVLASLRLTSSSDTATAAVALTAMTEQSASQWFVTDAGGPDDVAAAAEKLTDMWHRMLGTGTS